MSGIPAAKQGARQQEPCALFCGGKFAQGARGRGLPPSVKTYTRGKGGKPMWRLGDLRRKEVVNIRDGTRLGFVTDVEIDEVDGRIESLVVPGPTRLFGLFGREEDYIIRWDEIETLGEDIVLVSVAMPDRRAQGARERRVRRRHFSY